MILYHGSNVEIKFPKIIKNEKGKDFRNAFYLTPIKEEAIKKPKFQKINSQIAFYNENALKDLEFIKSFEVKE